jgi:hypothetical protein
MAVQRCVQSGMFITVDYCSHEAVLRLLQLRAFGFLALCHLRRARDRHVVSLGYRGCRLGRRRGR